jgi:hypothetical protein
VSEEGLSLVSCPCVIQEYIDHNGRFYKVYVIDKEVMVFQRNSLPNLTLTAHEDHPETCTECKRPDGVHSRSLAFDSRYKYPTFEDFYEHRSLPSLPSGEDLEGSDSGPAARARRREDGDGASPRGAGATSQESSESVSEGAGVGGVPNNGFRVASNCEDHLRSRFAKAAEIVSDGFSLTLFGFDVIIPVYDKSPELDKDTQLVIIDINFFPSYKEIPDFPDKLCKYMRKRAGLDNGTITRRDA